MTAPVEVAISMASSTVLVLTSWKVTLKFAVSLRKRMVITESVAVSGPYLATARVAVLVVAPEIVGRVRVSPLAVEVILSI